MTSTWRPQARRLGRFLGANDGWIRPQPTATQRRLDIVIALSFWGFAMLSVELVRMTGLLHAVDAPILAQHIVIASATLPLALRRTYPVAIGAYAIVHMLLAGIVVGPLVGQLPLQVTYFFALYSAVAWARDRQAMVVIIGSVLLMIFVWITYQVAVSKGVEDILGSAGKDASGLLSPILAGASFMFLVNVLYFGGAVMLGQNAWLAARHTYQVAEQRETIARQADQLRDRAVIEERLRIARELHDVVAHHVSVMGVQAGAARRLLTRDPGQASTALRCVEDTSRDAVHQMRGLLGTLRASAATNSLDVEERSAQPGIDELAQLIEQARVPGLDVTYQLVGSEYAGRLPGQIGLSIYRIVQEALANVRKHSTASTASVVVRLNPCWAELEVLDNGRPKGTLTSGTGLGHLGIRERISSLSGQADIGPRTVGGYRVRVRFPMTPTPPTTTR